MSSSLTLSDTEFNQVILDLAEADKLEKQAKKIKGSLRSTLFHVATLENEKQELPRKTMRLPIGFLNKIGMQENHFLQSRYPGWRKVESRKVEDEGKAVHYGTWIEYLLEKDPALLPFSTEGHGDGFRVTAGRTVQQNPPDLDQRTLQKDLPELFDKIMKPVVIYEVDADKLESLIGENPDLLPQIERHLAYPDPIAKLSPMKEVEEDG